MATFPSEPRYNDVRRRPPAAPRPRLKMRRNVASLVIVAAAAILVAACSLSNSTFPRAPVPALSDGVSKRLDYYYALRSRAISQWALQPSIKHGAVQFASDYELPSGCKAPSAVRIVASKNRAFVACAGEILPLALNAKHALATSNQRPFKVAGVVSLIAPESGIPDLLYADTSGGQIVALSYAGKTLKRVGTYQMSSSGPSEMAFYTGAHGSALYVAAFADQDGCNGPGGAIDVWTQGANGSLTAAMPIQDCNNAMHVVIAGSTLYWAGFSEIGAYNLATSTAISPLPAPWLKTKNGPSLNPDSMTVARQQYASNAALAPRGIDRVSFATAGSYGGIVLFGSDGKVAAKLPAPRGVSKDDDVECVCYGTVVAGPPVTIDGETFDILCWQATDAGIVITGHLAGDAYEHFVNINTVPYADVVEIASATDGDFPK